MLEKASRAVWELILDDDNLGKEISETVEKVYMKLSGCEPPVPPSPGGHPPPAERGAGEREGGEEEHAKQREALDSSGKKGQGSQAEAGGGPGRGAEREVAMDVDSTRRKRSFSEMSSQAVDADSADPFYSGA